MTETKSQGSKTGVMGGRKLYKRTTAVGSAADERRAE